MVVLSIDYNINIGLASLKSNYKTTDESDISAYRSSESKIFAGVKI